MSEFDYGNEWPCDGCIGLRTRYFDRWHATEPPATYCAEPHCSVDVACLRELETVVGLYCDMVNGILAIESKVGIDAVYEFLAECGPEQLAEIYADSRVGERAIRDRIVPRSRRRIASVVAV
jgi:hypothetical protein